MLLLKTYMSYVFLVKPYPIHLFPLITDSLGFLAYVGTPFVLLFVVMSFLKMLFALSLLFLVSISSQVVVPYFLVLVPRLLIIGFFLPIALHMSDRLIHYHYKLHIISPLQAFLYPMFLL